MIAPTPAAAAIRIPPTLNRSAAPLKVWIPPGRPVLLAAPFQADQVALEATVLDELTEQAPVKIAHTGVGVATTATHDVVIG